jgi:hypothetical protein
LLRYLLHSNDARSHRCLAPGATPFKGTFTDEFGEFDSLADLFRQIGYDERLHKLESEARMGTARFR